MDSSYEEPRKLIPQILEHLNPTDDVESQRCIEANLKKAESLRTQFRELSYKSLSEMERKAEIMKDVYQSKLIERESSASLHASKMLELSKTKFSLSQQVEDFKTENASLDAELNELEKQMQILEAEEALENQLPPDETSVKLQLCHALGIDLLQNPKDGTYDKARIISKQNNDIVTVEFNPQLSNFYYANLLWNTCN